MQDEKERLLKKVKYELYEFGPLTSIMCGEQGAKYPVQMKADGSFWYGDKQLPVEFFNDEHRRDVFRRLGKPVHIGKDGCAEFVINVPKVDHETAGNDDYETVKQWLRVPKQFLGASK
jgi:hypothetical protein